MPVLNNVDLTSVSTKNEAFPELESGYLVTFKESEISEDQRSLILKMRIDEPAEYAGREYWDWINLVQNDGKTNQISLKHIKRYLEAVFGEGSAEAEASPPDTDVLNAHQARIFMVQRGYKDKKTGEDRMANDVKRIFKA